MRLGSNFSSEDVYHADYLIPGFKSRVGRFTQVFILKQELLT